MSRSKKPEKCMRNPNIRPETPEIGSAIHSSGWGRTERIRRRNRQMWSRLVAKRRRVIDKKITNESS